MRGVAATPDLWAKPWNWVTDFLRKPGGRVVVHRSFRRRTIKLSLATLS